MSALNIYTESKHYSINCLVTHGGVFHADDVISTAILENLAIYESLNLNSISELPGHEEMVNAELSVVEKQFEVIAPGEEYPDACIGYFPIVVCRFRDFNDTQGNLSSTDFIYDVGFGEFDHHQKDCKLHPDGRRYCALSLIWEMLQQSNWVFGIDQGDLDSFTNLLVTAIETADTTGTQNALSVMISTFNTNVNVATPAEQNRAFSRVVLNLMRDMNSWFFSMAKRAAAIRECEESLEEFKNVITGQFYVVLPREYQGGVIAAAVDSDCIAACYPSARGGFAVRSIDETIDGKNFNRFSYPQIIRDHPGFIEGLEFCHPAGFYGKFDTMENAKRFMESTYLVANKRP